MPELYLADIPIYRTSPEIFYQDVENQRIRRQQELEAHTNGRGLSEEFKAGVHVRIVTQNGGPWRFNQIIGWLRIYKLGRQLRGEYWFVESKRILKNPLRKQLCWQGNAFEFTVYEGATSEEILNELFQEISAFERSFKPRRYLDYSEFRTISKFVDWRAVMSNSEQNQ